MKPIEQYTSAEKGKMLAEFFPQEVTQIIRAIDQQCTYLQGNPEEVKAVWNSGIITAESWISLASKVKQTIDKYGGKLHGNPRLFADQLFNGYLSFVTIDCICKYADKDREGTRFQAATHFLFNNFRKP